MNLLIQQAKKFLSPDAGPLAQFVKYGAVGVMATLVQAGVFYALACTAFKCLTPDDLMVRLLGMPSVEIAAPLRALYAAINTSFGFVLANVFCWLMNRWFVFKAGKYVWYVELALFFAVSLAAVGVGLAVQSVLIHFAGWTTSSAFLLEILSSLAINFVVRKFFVFKG